MTRPRAVVTSAQMVCSGEWVSKVLSLSSVPSAIDSSETDEAWAHPVRHTAVWPRIASWALSLQSLRDRAVSYVV
jgi:hypothetical protein